MNQPELGKKIAELRRSRGFTQEELVTKCKLNIRTLQRIECGEVEPRSYTVKAIFEALNFDYDTIDVHENIKEPESVKKKIFTNQMYEYVIDLFNFKTKKMRKLMILTVLTLCIAFAGTSFISAGNPENDNQMVGTWVLCNSQGEPMYSKNNIAEFKVISPQTFTVLLLNKENKSVFAQLMGTYTLKNNVYTETITHAHPSMVDYPGTVNEFKISFKNDLLIFQGVNNVYNQVWKKVDTQMIQNTENN